MGSERRRHPRVTADLPFRLIDEKGGEEAFQLVDLSECGARIQCGHAIKAMTRIRVAMVIPGDFVGRDDDVQMDTTGVVVWSHPARPGQYDTGVFFPDLADDQRDLLAAFVRGA